MMFNCKFRLRVFLFKLALGVSLFTPFNSYANLPVLDGASLAESITQKIIAIEQWARDNIIK